MSSQRFVYTVSGIELTDAQKSHISEEIAAAVTRALLGEMPTVLDSGYLSEHPLCGGSHIHPEDLDSPTEAEPSAIAPQAEQPDPGREIRREALRGEAT
ncbi:MAG TPA: hypothetical protein VEW71_04135 [Allosphingosinicella sp.]|nr:hypothetical protein [Allosphingosinicella sp.]